MGDLTPALPLQRSGPTGAQATSLSLHRVFCCNSQIIF